jgi:hypothetical protein
VVVATVAADSATAAAAATATAVAMAVVVVVVVVVVMMMIIVVNQFLYRIGQASKVYSTLGLPHFKTIGS